MSQSCSCVCMAAACAWQLRVDGSCMCKHEPLRLLQVEFAHRITAAADLHQMLLAKLG